MWLIKKTRAEVITILTLQPLTALFLFPRRKKAEMEGERTQRHVSVSQHRPVLGGVLLTLNFFFLFFILASPHEQELIRLFGQQAAQWL